MCIRDRGLGDGEETAVIGEDRGELTGAYIPHGSGVADKALQRRIVEENDITVGRHPAVRLDVLGAGGVSRGEGRCRVLPDAGVPARRGDQTAVSEDSGVGCLLEVGVRHAPGWFVGGCPGFGVNAVPMPLSASVSSLGMIQSLSLIHI